MLDHLIDVCETIARLDLSDPDSARRLLNETVDAEALEAAIREATDLTPRQAGPNVKFGRVAKPSDTTHQLSIDAVEMYGEAAEHTHPNGEVSFCVALDGEPTFMGEPPGWVVVPPGSRHVPTVRNGTMRILYFLPGGAMIWH